ncbi:MAG: methionyl-tRNA formyltransferase, partial [Planctomycetota bacterium]
SRHEVVATVTRPPRGRRPEVPPMQQVAESLQLPVLQPETVNSADFHGKLKELDAELLVVCDYGEILKAATLAATPLGGVNLHGSLLPKYRGAAPVQWALLDGETVTGNTVIQMTPGLDAGPCLGVQKVAIDPDETAGELEQRLSELGGDLLLDVVDKIDAGTAAPVEQESSLASKAPRLTKQHGLIDWSRSAVQIKNQVRALRPWPRAFTHLYAGEGDALRLIVHRAAPWDAADRSALGDATSLEPGAVVACDARLAVATGDGVVDLVEIQPSGKRKMAAAEFLRGHSVRVGDRMGDK